MVDLLRLRSAGLSNVEIAKRLGVSPQRVWRRLAPAVAIRRLLIEQARGQCANCGRRIGQAGRIYHRLIRGLTLDEYNDLGNLVWLCRECHRRVDAARGGQQPLSHPAPRSKRLSATRVGHNILQRRLVQQLTLKQLAARAHISRLHLARIEQGDQQARGDVLARIARMLRCSAAELESSTDA